MHILYLDESGTHSRARYFVVAGIALFERDIFYLAKDLDQIQARHFPDLILPAPFHVSSLRSKHPEPPFDRLSRDVRLAIIDEIHGIIAASSGHIFAVAWEKVATNGDPYERGFEEIMSRFDMMVSRVSRERGEDHRGLIVVAESSYRNNLELLARKIAREGHRWGDVHNLADIPYFAPAASTRLLQIADFIANTVYGRYEEGHARLFDLIAPRIDQDQGNIHGLVHIARNRQSCYCPVCVARRARTGDS